MKIRTNELTGAALDWGVAKCEGEYCTVSTTGRVRNHQAKPLNYSTEWAQGGPIIAREGISIDQRKGEPCRAFLGVPVRHEYVMFSREGQPLVAAMRTFVASKLGDEVEIPDELVGE